MQSIIPLLLGVLAGGATLDARAENWLFKIGAHSVDPTSGNGRLAGGTLGVDIGANVRPTVTGEYFWTPNWSVEVLAALPFKHEVKLNGVKAATVKHLPPVVGIQYHFNAEGRVSPFVGVGLNYTYIFGERTTGALSGARLSLDNSIGAAAHVGIDFKLDDAWRISVDARWIDIDSDARVNGADVGTVSIDPLVFGVAVGRAF
ncbi:OmpW/AlkL family protein [Tahibacter amnicola]|uniref:OmpW/AlkL family protein n=1 Tax=Tahibacter amnicola TaxID=2976241 RepID=UPI003CCD4497